jgi:hypothetical protein
MIGSTRINKPVIFVKGEFLWRSMISHADTRKTVIITIIFAIIHIGRKHILIMRTLGVRDLSRIHSTLPSAIYLPSSIAIKGRLWSSRLLLGLCSYSRARKNRSGHERARRALRFVRRPQRHDLNCCHPIVQRSVDGLDLLLRLSHILHLLP